jgi:hypothetical protein
VEFFRAPADNDPLREGTGGSAGLADPAAVSNDRPIPAAIYYALDHHEQFWLLAFDIDAKDVAKENAENAVKSSEIDGEFDDVMQSMVLNETPTIGKYTDILTPDNTTTSSANTTDDENTDPDGDGHQSGITANPPSTIPDNEYEYRYKDIQQALEYAFTLKDWLASTVGFTDVRVFYSGQGAHVYALDDDPQYKFTHQTRKVLTTYITERLHIPIDPEVTWDQRRVIRLPYSLHTDVSRVVTEIDSPDFDFRTKPVPSYLTDSIEVN